MIVFFFLKRKREKDHKILMCLFVCCLSNLLFVLKKFTFLSKVEREMKKIVFIFHFYLVLMIFLKKKKKKN